MTWDWLRQTFIEPAETSAAAHAVVPPPSRCTIGLRSARANVPPHLQQVALPAIDEVAACRAVAVDFETATASRASPCAIGLAWLGPSGVAHRAYRLIRPPGNAFSGFNVGIHGIRPQDVEDAPPFAHIWEQLAPLMRGRTLIAHNAAFDTGVLAAALRADGLAPPDLPILCTLHLARRAWPELARHRLSDVASHLGLALRHHHALDDAEASAAIVLHAATALGIPFTALLDGAPVRAP